MAFFKKSLFIVFAFLLAFASFIFIPQNKMQITYATSEPTYDNTYTYNGEVDSAVNGIGDYAISDIEYLRVGGTFVIHLLFDTDKISSDYLFWIYSNSYWETGTTEWYGGFYHNGYGYMNDLFFACLPRNPKSSALKFYSDGNYTYVSFKANKGLIDIYFSQNKFVVNDRNKPYDFTFGNYVDGNIFNYDLSTDFSSLVDMNSETQFSDVSVFDLGTDLPNFPVYSNELNMYSLRYVLYDNLISLQVGGDSIQGENFGDNITPYRLANYSFIERGLININPNSEYADNVANAPKCTMYMQFTNANNLASGKDMTYYSYDSSKLIVNDFYFYIKKPIHRINNTLVLYNFDYIDFLENVESISYSLSKGSDLYVVDYVGSVPNSKYIYVYNNEIQNITFDEYIYLYMIFKDNMLPAEYGVVNIDTGFDFNFTYYAEPLVLNDGSYNYEFEKPAYRDGKIGFSMNPPQLHIPIEAWVYNAVIFLCFYCPIISDILNLLHINYFINSLMTVFTMFAGSAIGQFVNACICFLLFWGIMKGLMPSMGGAFVGGVKNTYGAVKGSIVTLYKDATAGRRISKRVDYDEKMFNKRMLQVKNYRNKKGKMFGNPKKYKRYIKKSR